MSPPPILVADTADSFQLLSQGVVSTLVFSHVASMAEARQALQPDTPLVVCGCHFDDGRMYDLLRYMKASSALRGVPFMAIRVLEGELEDALYESVKIATRALGGDSFVDLYRWQRLYGEAEAAHRLTQRIVSLAGTHNPGST